MLRVSVDWNVVLKLLEYLDLNYLLRRAEYFYATPEWVITMFEFLQKRSLKFSLAQI